MLDRDRRNAAAGVGAAVAALALFVASGRPASAAVASGKVSIRGSVTDENGAGVSGQTVRLLKSRAILRLSGLKTTEQNVEEVRASTDPHGLFEFTVTPDPKFRYYYLRFYDPQSFDTVKYRLPDDLEVSRKIRQGRDVTETIVLRPRAEWPKVKALIDEYGPASHCGQILRALGLPTRRTPEGAGRELWEFDAAGVAYLVEGQKVLETRRLSPATEPARAGDGSSPDHPEPATRVDGP